MCLCSQLVLTHDGLVLVRLVDGRDREGDIVAKRSLASIMKITSKKKHPDLITFKYGATKPDGETVITDMDRSVGCSDLLETIHWLGKFVAYDVVVRFCREMQKVVMNLNVVGRLC